MEKKKLSRNLSGDDDFIIQLSTGQSHEQSSFSKEDEIQNTDLKSYKEHVLTITEAHLPTQTNPSSPDKRRGIKAFLRFLPSTLINIPPEQHGALFLLCASFLAYQVNTNSSNPFELQSSSPHYTLLTLEEAFPMFLPEMAHISKFMLSYFLTLVLVWPLQPGVRFFLLLLLVPTPVYYFPQLARQVHGIDVDCSLFKLRLIWFATLGALCLCLTCGFVTMVIVYFSWKHMNHNNGKGIRGMKELKVSLGDIAGGWGAG